MNIKNKWTFSEAQIKDVDAQTAFLIELVADITADVDDQLDLLGELFDYTEKHGIGPDIRAVAEQKLAEVQALHLPKVFGQPKGDPDEPA